jgi:hypothetical protein
MMIINFIDLLKFDVKMYTNNFGYRGRAKLKKMLKIIHGYYDPNRRHC